MEIREALGKIEKPTKESYNVGRETLRLQNRYKRQMKALRESLSFDQYRSAALQATEIFKKNLKQFLAKNGREDLYQQIVGFLSGKVAEIASTSPEASSAH